MKMGRLGAKPALSKYKVASQKSDWTVVSNVQRWKTNPDILADISTLTIVFLYRETLIATLDVFIKICNASCKHIPPLASLKERLLKPIKSKLNAYCYKVY